LNPCSGPNNQETVRDGQQPASEPAASFRRLFMGVARDITRLFEKPGSAQVDVVAHKGSEIFSATPWDGKAALIPVSAIAPLPRGLFQQMDEGAVHVTG
jgi:hypothetical protein